MSTEHQKYSTENQAEAIQRYAAQRGIEIVRTYAELLRTLVLEGRPLGVPLLVTVGPPLPLMAVQAALGPAFLRPQGVGRWLNAVDPADVIALGQGLDKSNFADGIDNIRDIQHTDDNPHSIQGYLGDSRVASAIATGSGI